jgi:hypothetical protein
MLFEREAGKPLVNPSPARIETELRKLKTEGPSSFAHLTAPNGDYLQTAGSPAGLLLEKRNAQTGQHYRAFQSKPVVPFEDGTELVFSSGRIPLRSVEWFQLRQVLEAFTAFLEGAKEPSYLHWREITELLTDRTNADPGT